MGTISKELSAKIKSLPDHDHHIFSKEEVAEIINLQPLKDGKAKPYQVKQVRGVILKYKLHKGAKDV